MRPLCMCCLLARFRTPAMSGDPTLCTSASSQTDFLGEPSSFQVIQLAIAVLLLWRPATLPVPRHMCVECLHKHQDHNRYGKFCNLLCFAYI